MFGSFKVAHLLGLTRGNEALFKHVEYQLTLKKEYICFRPVVYDMEVWKDYEKLLDDMCYEKLKVCDLCVVVTPTHIGKSTSTRIAQAKELNIPVYTWDYETDQLGEVL